MIRALIVTALVGLTTAGAFAAAPYAGLQDRELKALSPEAVQDYLAGRGMGLALAAELNGYPGPLHVLELAGELALSEEQRERTQVLYEEMRAAAVELGASIVEREAKLDALFAAGDADPRQVEALSKAIGTLQGKLRAVHLNTHIAQRALLTDIQIQRYRHARGYGGGDHAHHHHQRHGHTH
jgi:Spy/CpxP family protein refolding chaperone